MRVSIINYNSKEHENFVKSYLVNCINHGFIYDMTPEKKKVLTSFLIDSLKYSVIKIAVNSDDPKEYIGFAMADSSIVPTLYFIYVKKQHQRHGVGTMLLDNVLNNLIGEIIVPMKSPNLNLFFKAKNTKAVVRYFDQVGK